jgi:hypothetical protein
MIAYLHGNYPNKSRKWVLYYLDNKLKIITRHGIARVIYAILYY